MPVMEAVTEHEVDEYAAAFAADFGRRDRARWLGVYLRGLLGEGRKNAESLARSVDLPAGVRVDDLTQALQNFVNQSPWDEQKLWRRYRAHLAHHLGTTGGAFVIDEVCIAKQGQQSVGVQRQFCGRTRRKLNCQLAVLLSYATPHGSAPLALRLYLPRDWLRQPEKLAAAGVPERLWPGASKADIALDLIDQVRAEGFTANVVAARAPYGSHETLRAGLIERGLRFVLGVGDDFALDGGINAGDLVRRAGLRPLWWEAVGGRERCALLPVALPDGGAGNNGGLGNLNLLAEAHPGGYRQALALLAGDGVVGDAARAWHTLADSDHVIARLRELGLDHFEGRSWRGFHHHACLVMLAYGFTLAERV